MKEIKENGIAQLRKVISDGVVSGCLNATTNDDDADNCIVHWSTLIRIVVLCSCFTMTFKIVTRGTKCTRMQIVQSGYYLHAVSKNASHRILTGYHEFVRHTNDI